MLGGTCGKPYLALSPSLIIIAYIVVIILTRPLKHNGYRYVLQLTEALHEQGRDAEENELALLREQAILALDRSHSLVRRAEEGQAPDGERPRTWNPSDKTTHPEHIRMMMKGQSLSFMDGMISYLYGRVYEDWSDSIEHQMEAVEYV